MIKDLKRLLSLSSRVLKVLSLLLVLVRTIVLFSSVLCLHTYEANIIERKGFVRIDQNKYSNKYGLII